MQAASWCRANAMLLISLLLAAVTAFFVPPDAQYLGYYDLKTLACLFSVLAVVAALRDLNIFAALSQRLVRTFGTVRSVAAMLIIITMLGSMLLTNDTALLTFLPLSWFVMHSTGQDKHIPLLFVLQNCAANLCGMLTPFGNPQNLYLFSYYNIPTSEFLSIMLPPFAMSTVLILLCCFAFPRTRLSVPDAAVSVNGRRAAVYGLLFALAVAWCCAPCPTPWGLSSLRRRCSRSIAMRLKRWTGGCLRPLPRSSPFPAIFRAWRLSTRCLHGCFRTERCSYPR